MKILLSLAATLPLLASSGLAQCRETPAHCGPIHITCVGQPNIGCRAFAVEATRLDPRAPGAVALISGCPANPTPIPSPPACGLLRCLLLVDNPAIVLPVAPNFLGGHLLRLPVPNDPAVIGSTICVQYAQVARVPGTNRPCLSLSNGLSIRVGRGRCQ